VTLGVVSVCAAQDAPRVGVEEHLGDVIPVETFSFVDEEGEPIDLKGLFDRPIVLTLVYFRCPGICTPLLQELVRNVDNCDLAPGEDYRLITVSFDPTETAEMAERKKTNMLGALKRKDVQPDAWRFLTGEEDDIRRLTDAVGFYYMKDENQQDYIHAASVMFLSPDGKIVRYLNGTEFNPADLEMAVIDASEGRARSFIQKVQKLCYTYDPGSRGYVLQLNRIILGITVVFVAVFGGFLLLKSGRHSQSVRQSQGAAQ
jgi:protein SCO1/2